VSTDVQKFEVPINPDANGCLGIIEFESLDFVPQRIYWLSDIPQGGIRGRHAHKSLRQIFVLMQGNMSIEIFQGSKKILYELKSRGESLVVPPGLWRNICNASEDAILLVLCDQSYSEEDYIRDFNAYLTWYGQKDA
jgi:dTDP-4-dehydrorhamnose 3,5-epimerase-like enzyme